MPLGIKPLSETMLTQFYVTLCHYQATGLWNADQFPNILTNFLNKKKSLIYKILFDIQRNLEQKLHI